jgi:hypothetical protein
MAELTSEISALRERVATLEQEVFENRALNRRLAELIDVVSELLLPAAYPDEQRLRARYSAVSPTRADPPAHGSSCSGSASSTTEPSATIAIRPSGSGSARIP